jgi:hypothetical protein
MKKFRILILLLFIISYVLTESSTLEDNIVPQFSKNLRSQKFYGTNNLLSLEKTILSHNHENTNIPNLGILVNQVAYGEVPAEHHLDKGGRSIEFNDNNYSVTVGVLKERPNIMIAMVRGTHTLQNIIIDINALQESVGMAWKVHKGFYKAYQEIKNTLFNLISEMQKNYLKITDIFFMGHSLGGAIATFGAVEYTKMLINKNNSEYKPDLTVDLNKNISASLITFGAPRVGNRNFADMVNSLPLKYNYRVIIGNDPVPNVPFKNFITGDYLHAGTEIRYLEDKELNNPVIGEKYTDTCTSDLSIEFLKDKITNIQAHLRYFEIEPLPLWIMITNERIG